MPEDLQIGSTVQLKSGGPLMTVTGLTRNSNGQPFVHTAWFDGDVERQAYFPVAALEKAQRS